MPKWSKKLAITIGTAVLVLLNDKIGLGLEHETIVMIVTTAVGYLLGQSAVDVSKNVSDAKVRVALAMPAPLPAPPAANVTVTQEGAKL